MKNNKIYLVIIIVFIIVNSTAYSYISGHVLGIVRDAETSQPISNATLKTSAGRSAITFNDGSFIIDHEAGSFLLTVFAEGYESYSGHINIQAIKTMKKNIELTPISINENLPVIDSVSQKQTLYGKTAAIIQAENIKSSVSIEKVEGIIIPPQNPQIMINTPLSGLPVLNFTEISGTNNYSATYDNFSTIGNYKIIIRATDIYGNTSLPLTASVTQTIGPDVFEEDDTIDQAKPVVLNARNARRHTFYDVGDQDWIMFYGIFGKTYHIETSRLEILSEPVIDFYGPGKNYIFSRPLIDDDGDGVAYLEWIVNKEGVYYFCVKNIDANVFGANTGYDLRVGYPEGSWDGHISGKITDIYGSPLRGINIKTNHNGSGISDIEGNYVIFDHQTGATTITFLSSSLCYANKADTMTVKKFETTLFNIRMENIALSDAIKHLQLISGISIPVNGSYIGNNIGLDDAIYMLKCLEY